MPKRRGIDPDLYSSKSETDDDLSFAAAANFPKQQRAKYHIKPNGLSFDGTEVWNTFKIRFNRYARESGWFEKKAKYAFYGKAADYLALINERGTLKLLCSSWLLDSVPLSFLWQLLPDSSNSDRENVILGQ